MEGSKPSQLAETVWSARADFPLYVVLKAYICRSHAAASKNSPAAKFTARRVLNLVGQPNPARREELFTDFFDVSAQLIRERLKSLNSGTVLQSTGRGVRNTLTYAWNEHLPPSAIVSYWRMQALLNGSIEVGMDVFRLAEAYDGRPFARAEFLRLLSGHREQFSRQEGLWGSGGGASKAFTWFLARRFDRLVGMRLIEADGNQMFRLSRRALEAAHWFELFVHSVEYGTEPGAVLLP